MGQNGQRLGPLVSVIRNLAYVLNGTGAVVERVSGRDITVRTEAGVLSLPTGSMAARGIDHAYAMTAHAYQGQTVPNIIIGMSVTRS